MSAATLNLTVEQYASFSGGLTLTDAGTNKPSNIASVTAKMAITAMYGRPALISLSSPGNGLILVDSPDHTTTASTITINLTAAQTASLTVAPNPTVIPPKQNYYYDLILEYPTGIVTRLVQGTISVIMGATND